MLMVTTDLIPGKSYEVVGFVDGATVQSVHAGKDIFNGLKTLVGGELNSYTEMMESSRKIATERMCAKANALGADAIVGVKFGSSAIVQGAAEVFAYGTAVRFV